MEPEKIPRRRRHIYLCPSVEHREKLFREFTQAMGPGADVVISRWRDLPHKADDILCVVVSATKHADDARCNKLQAHGIEVVYPAWIEECIAQCQILPLPSQKLAVIPTSSSMRAGTSEWTKAEDGVIRAIRESRLRGGDNGKQNELELLLLQRKRTLVEMHNRECVLFGEPEWTAKDDAIIAQIHHFKGNTKRIAQLEKSFKPKRTLPQVRYRLRSLGFQ